MTSFVRVKDYVINLQNVTYIRVEKDHIDFGLASPVGTEGRHMVRVERGAQVNDVEFEQIKEFVLDLPDPDRVIVV